jgi:hypothetical protein
VIGDEDLVRLLAPKRYIAISREEAAAIGAGPLEDWDVSSDRARLVTPEYLSLLVKVAREDGRRASQRGAAKMAANGFVCGAAVTFALWVIGQAL